MQVQNISNGQNFGMALKKPQDANAIHIDRLFRGDTEGATQFAEKYISVKNNQRKNKVCDIIFNEEMITDRGDDNAAKIQYSINVIDRKSLKTLVTYLYQTLKQGVEPNMEAVKKGLIKSLEDADVKASEIEAQVKTKTDSSSILERAYNSGGFFGKSKKVITSQDEKEQKGFILLTKKKGT